MRRLIEYVLVSADGVFEEPVALGVGAYQDEAYFHDGLNLLVACDAVLFGRTTYEAFERLYHYGEHKPLWAERLTEIPKYVFSTTLEHAEWHNSTILRVDPGREVAYLKRQDGQDLLILGHGQLAETLLGERLTDGPAFRDDVRSPPAGLVMA